MYGVVEIKGHQYRVSAGDIIDVEKMTEDEGNTIELDDVLFVGGETPLIGFPTVDGANIKAKVVKHDKSRKLLMIRRRPRGWKKTKGHRQNYTCLLITEISDGKGNVDTIDSSSKNAQKFLK